MLIWAKSPGSVKHQVVDWGSFSSNRWLKHFTTNGHGTTARQPIFQLLLYVTAATHPGRWSSCSPAPGPPWNQPGLGEPPCLLPACCSGDTAAGAHTGRWEKSQGLPSHTRNLGNAAPREKPQSAAQPVTLTLRCFISHVKMYYFSTIFTCSLSYLPACKEIVSGYFQP